MTGPLRVGDCLCSRLIQVNALHRYRDVVATGPTSPKIFAVLDDEENFLGMVDERQAALFPSRIFADLIVRRVPAPVLATDSLEQALARLEHEKADYLPVVDQDGKMLGAISHSSLVVGLLQAERATLEERESLINQLEAELNHHRIAASVFDTTSEGILVTDAKASIVLVNRAFENVTGYRFEEVRGHRPALLQSGIHDTEFYAKFWSALQDKGAWQGEIWNKRKNGETYPEWLHVNAVRDTSGVTTHYVGIFSDISAHKEVQERLHQMAYFDNLTGLPNRQLFLDRLERVIARCQRNETGVSLLFIDLDRFKNINDSLGHGFGDQVLIQAANKMREIIRDADTIARLGGDEFTILIEDGGNEQAAEKVASKVIETLGDHFSIAGREVFVSASIGISRYPTDGTDAESLLKNADLAMYQAKESGRSVYQFFKPDMNEKLTERFDLEDGIRHGIDKNQFWLAYQPQLRLSDGQVTGVEVLLRWQHPEMGEIPPAKFIPIAEDCGLINMLGQWVVRRAAEQISELEGLVEKHDFRLAVNFSPAQLAEKTIEEIISAIQLCQKSAVVELEITESTLMTGDKLALGFFEALAHAGVQVSVDDFGTGYSNLANLRRLPIHRLKVDRSFVQDLESDEASRQIVTAIINMAHCLGMKVVAEGVETSGQAQILGGLDCDEVQGYLYSRPLPMDQFHTFLKRHGH
ncbi:MAG: EAL domain-containing protein [Rhodocyclaceae bacterium]|nr:MAG: EAL domain-containing protein [Rhodocyclaceae bacterium]